jgi:hypothetical protein
VSRHATCTDMPRAQTCHVHRHATCGHPARPRTGG